MRIHISNENGDGDSTTVETESGEKIAGIAAIDIQIRPRSAVTASLQFQVPPLRIAADAVVSVEHLQELAEYHGYKLVPIEGAA